MQLTYSPEAVLEKYDAAIHKVCHKYYFDNPRFSYDDLVSEARMVAIKAARAYNPNHESGASFLTWLLDSLDTEIREYVSRNRYDLTVTEHQQRKDYANGTLDRLEREASAKIRLDYQTELSHGLSLPFELSIPSGYPSPEDIMIHSETIDVLREEIEALPEREKAVINLRWFENKTLNEIAASMRVAKQTIYGWEKSGLDKLAKRVKARLGE
jgi:RNA polymerase sigma factor (sigma-70 family)